MKKPLPQDTENGRLLIEQLADIQAKKNAAKNLDEEQEDLDTIGNSLVECGLLQQDAKTGQYSISNAKLNDAQTDHADQVVRKLMLEADHGKILPKQDGTLAADPKVQKIFQDHLLLGYSQLKFKPQEQTAPQPSLETENIPATDHRVVLSGPSLRKSIRSLMDFLSESASKAKSVFRAKMDAFSNIPVQTTQPEEESGPDITQEPVMINHTLLQEKIEAAEIRFNKARLQEGTAWNDPHALENAKENLTALKAVQEGRDIRELTAKAIHNVDKTIASASNFRLSDAQRKYILETAVEQKKHLARELHEISGIEQPASIQPKVAVIQAQEEKKPSLLTRLATAIKNAAIPDKAKSLYESAKSKAAQATAATIGFIRGPVTTPQEVLAKSEENSNKAALKLMMNDIAKPFKWIGNKLNPTANAIKKMSKLDVEDRWTIASVATAMVIGTAAMGMNVSKENQKSMAVKKQAPVDTTIANTRKMVTPKATQAADNVYVGKPQQRIEMATPQKQNVQKTQPAQEAVVISRITDNEIHADTTSNKAVEQEIVRSAPLNVGKIELKSNVMLSVDQKALDAAKYSALNTPVNTYVTKRQTVAEKALKNTAAGKILTGIGHAVQNFIETPDSVKQAQEAKFHKKFQEKGIKPSRSKFVQGVQYAGVVLEEGVRTAGHNFKENLHEISNKINSHKHSVFETTKKHSLLNNKEVDIHGAFANNTEAVVLKAVVLKVGETDLGKTLAQKYRK